MKQACRLSTTALPMRPRIPTLSACQRSNLPTAQKSTPWLPWSSAESPASLLQPARKPLQIALQQISLMPRFGDPVSFTRIDDVLHWNLAVGQRPIDFAVMVDVEPAHLQQRGRMNVGDPAARRVPIVSLRLLPRRAAEVRHHSAARSIGLAIVGDPIGGWGAHRCSFEPVGMADDPGGPVAAIAPAHHAQAL